MRIVRCRLLPSLMLVLASAVCALCPRASAATAPTVLGVTVERGEDSDAWGWLSSHQNCTVQVNYPEAGRLGCLYVTDPLGDTFYYNTCTGDHWVSAYDAIHIGESPYHIDTWLRDDGGGTFTCGSWESGLFAPPPAGVFAIELRYDDVTVATVTTPAAPPVAEEVPVLAAPAPDAVIDQTVPIFQWVSLPSADSRLEVREEGNTFATESWADDAGRIWSADLSGAAGGHEVTYDFDSAAVTTELEAGRGYVWQITSRTLASDSGSGSSPRVQFWQTSSAGGRFTVYAPLPSLPDLPGKLAYNYQMWGPRNEHFKPDGLQLYTTDLRDRTWLAPDSAGFPNWSWDGRRLLYYRNDLGLWIDSSFDRSVPYHLPIDVWGENTWSPDSTRVAFGWVPPGAAYFQIWMANNDGSDLHLVAASETGDIMRLGWSPDGRFIVQTRSNDPSGNNIWLTRADGSESHPLLVTDVVGHPGYRVVWMNRAVWSPDARQLAVYFTAQSADGLSFFDGIGTVSSDGGPLTVSFVTPPGIVCCAQPDVGCWAPDGAHLVMSSAHHLPIDPDWQNGKLETGKELWLIRADGSGEPVRLTYNNTFDWQVGWWAPNTEPGGEVAITKGDATLTFENVLTEGSTAVFVTPDSPGPAAANYTRRGDCWDALSDAGFTGSVLADLHYDRTSVPTGTAEAIRLLAWETDHWEDVTTSVDVPAMVVHGRLPGLTPFTLAGRVFTDVPADSWARGAIYACVNADVVQGYSATIYAPTDPVNRAQMAVYIARALAGGDGTVVMPTGPATFEDVPDTGYGDSGTDPYWAYRYIEYCVAHDVVRGYSATEYRPEDVVTRDQMAVFVGRARGWVGADDDMTTAPELFTDVPAGFWSGTAIQACVGHGVVQGYEGGSYAPGADVTRDMMAVYVQRAFQLPM